MARLTSTDLLGSVSGKVGTVVIATWNGIPYMRSLPGRRTGRISEREQANRDKFKKAQLWLKPLVHFVRIGFKNYSPTVRGFNAAKSLLMKNAMEKTDTGFVIHPSKVMVSWGDLPLPENLRMGEVENNKLPIYWEPGVKDWRSSHDQCMLLAYNVERKIDLMVLNGQFRDTGSDVLTLITQPGDTWHIYAAFISADRSRLSNSVYLGAVNT